MNTLKIGGLKERVEDKRDMALGAIIKWPKLSELPKEYWTIPLTIKDQNKDGNDDYCAACSGAGMIEPKEGTELFYPYLFAAAKHESGDDVADWGLSLKDVGKALTKWGVPDIKDVPEEVKNLYPDQRRNFDNYPAELKEKAKLHKQKTYFFVENSPYDSYDSARAAIWAFREKKQHIMLGVQFGWDLSQVELVGTPQGYGHALWCAGWNEKGLILVNSAGKEAGENGRHYISRETYNYFVEKYGQMMIVDLDRETAEYMLENNIKLTDSAITQTLKSIMVAVLDIAKSLLSIKKKELEAIKPEPVINNPTPMPQPVEEKYQWDTNEHVRLSLRKMGDEFKMTPLQKDLLCDICYCESGYNPKARLQNSPKSIDRGLFQWNSYWHPQITDEIAYNPEKNARLACQAILDNKMVTYWNASRKCWNSSGKYNELIKSFIK